MPSQTRPLVFPIKGLHESAGFDIQPPGTTSDALNVRAFDAIAGRARGGRRSGTSKYAYQTLTETAEPVQKLIKAVQGAEYQPPFNSLAEDWQGYAAEVQPDLSPRWAMVSILDEDSPNLSVVPDIWETTSNGLVWQKSSSTTGGPFLAHFVSITSDADPNMTVVIRAKPDITSGNASFGGANEPTWVGPFIKASPDLQNGFFACLVPASVASNTVSLKIYRMDPVGSSGYVPVATTTITLGGGSTVTTDCSIALWEYRSSGVSSTIRARLLWPGGGAAGADIDETIEYTDDTTDDGTNITYQQQGAGFGIWNPTTATGSDPTFTESTAFRTVDSVTARYRTPPLRQTVARWATTESGTYKYFRPRGFVSTLIDYSAGSYAVGSVDGYDSDTQGSDNMVVDTSTNEFYEGLVFGETEWVGAAMARPWDTGSALDAEVVVAGVEDVLEAFRQVVFSFRVDPTNNYGLNIVLSMSTSTAADAPNQLLLSSVTRYSHGAAGPGTETVLPLVPLVPGDVIRAEDHGSSLQLFVNGRVVYTLTLPSDGTVPPDAEGTYLAISQGIQVFTVLGNNVTEMRWVKRGGDAYSGGFTSGGKLLGVSGGSVVDLTGGLITPVATGVEALDDGYFNIQAAAAFGSVFFTDGNAIKQYKLSTGTVVTPTPSAGSFPSNPRLVCLYHGCLVWSGTVSDPHNWFMSAVGNPLDYDYSPATPTETQAVAGNNSVAGLIGDVINALIPGGEDYLYFGCDHSIWMMEGHPAAGGVITQVSDQTGMAFGSAWAKDPSGTIYFWGNDGVYRLVPGGAPQNMTKNRIDYRLKSVALDQNRIEMEWDYLRAQLIILIQPADPTESVRVIVWESRTDAWWEDEYPTAHGPNCLLAYDSSAANDQAFLFGGRDGYVRKIDDDASDDDGTAVASRVRLPMFIAPEGDREVILNSVLPVLAKGSSAVTVNVYSGQTAEGCATATTPRASALLAHAGRARSIRRPVRGWAVQVELSQAAGTYPWAVESIKAQFDPSGLPVRHARIASEGAAGGS